MQRIEILRRRLTTARELQSIVQSMKVITAAGIQQFENAVESLDEYYRTIEMGLQIFLQNSFHEIPPLHRAEEGDVGMVVFGSGQGLCGPFDETIVDYVTNQINKNSISNPRVYVLGTRASGYLEQSGLRIEHVQTLPGTVGGINETVNNMVVELERWQKEEHVEQILLFYNKPLSQGRYVARMQYLMPLDNQWFKRITNRPWPTNNLPQFTMNPKSLFSALIRQYLFVSLYQATAESLAAENISRLNSMQSAEQKIKEWLKKIENEYRQERHSAITEELLDIMAGFEVVREQDHS